MTYITKKRNIEKVLTVEFKGDEVPILMANKKLNLANVMHHRVYGLMTEMFKHISKDDSEQMMNCRGKMVILRFVMLYVWIVFLLLNHFWRGFQL